MKKPSPTTVLRKQLTEAHADVKRSASVIERLSDRANEGDKEKERLSAVWNLLEGERADLLARVLKIDALLHVLGRTAARHGSPSY